MRPPKPVPTAITILGFTLFWYIALFHFPLNLGQSFGNYGHFNYTLNVLKENPQLKYVDSEAIHPKDIVIEFRHMFLTSSGKKVAIIFEKDLPRVEALQAETCKGVIISCRNYKVFDFSDLEKRFNIKNLNDFFEKLDLVLSQYNSIYDDTELTAISEIGHAHKDFIVIGKW